MEIICVAPDMIDKTWPHVVHLIESAFHRGNADNTIEDIHADLKCGRALLWVIWSGSALAAAVTTALINIPNKGKMCLLTSCAGKDIHSWDHLIADIERYAIGEGCDLVRFFGRRGWARVMRRHGYDQPWIVMERALKG